MIRVGGGYQKFEDFVLTNHKNFERMLVSFMINNNKSLDWVVEQLILGKKIKSNILVKPSKTAINEGFNSRFNASDMPSQTMSTNTK